MAVFIEGTRGFLEKCVFQMEYPLFLQQKTVAKRQLHLKLIKHETQSFTHVVKKKVENTMYYASPRRKVS